MKPKAAMRPQETSKQRSLGKWTAPDRSRSRKRLAAIIIAGLFVAAMALAVALALNRPGGAADPERIVFSVEGEPVTLGEFRIHMAMERSAVTNYFNVTYGAEDGKAYWTTEFGGERPIEVLKQRAMERAVEAKTVQLLALARGLIADASFDRLLQAWQSGNQERDKNIQAGKTVFGLGQFALDQYYAYELGQLRLKLEDAAGQAELRVTEEELAQTYASHADKYSNRIRLTVEELSVPYTMETKTQVLADLKSLKERIAAGVSLAEAGADLSLDPPREMAFVADETEAPLQSDALLRQSALRLETGGVSDILDTGTGFSILRLIGKEANYAVPLDEVRAQLASETLRGKFDRDLSARTKRAKVELAKDVYEAILAP